MFQNRIYENTSSSQNNINDFSSNNNINMYNKRNTSQSKEKSENDILSNSVTSIGSNKDGYKNFVSKIKLNYNLINPQERTQTIILHKSLDKSYSSLNDSLTQNDNNNEIYENSPKDQLNTGFFKDNTMNNNNINTIKVNEPNDNKRNNLNYINKIYENERILDNSNLNDNSNINNNQPDKVKKDNLTINFNNNMFFVNDNHKQNINPNAYQNNPLNNIFNDYKKTSEDTFKNKVFISNNEFDDNYPGLKNDENDKEQNIQLPYGYQQNAFCVQNQNRNNQNNKNDGIYSNKKPLDYNYKNKDYSNINDLSTNLHTNNDNLNFEQNNNNNNNNGISPFNYENNNPSVNSIHNFGNSLSDINNYKNKDNLNINPNDNLNMKTSFIPNNYNNNDVNNNNIDNQNPDINYTSNIFPEKIITPNTNTLNNINNPNYQNIHNDNNNENENDNDNDNENDIYENESNNEILEISEPKFAPENNNENHNNISNNNNNNIIGNKNNNYPRIFTFDPNNYYSNNLIIDNINSDELKESNKGFLSDMQEDIYQNNNIQGINVNRNEGNLLGVNIKNKKYNLLRSLLYGLLLGSTTTALFWLRNEEARKILLEKYSRINFHSIIHFFKSIIVFPIEFFRRILNSEKRNVYLKVLGITFGKIYDFLENYGDGFRLLGVFLFVYGIWVIIKSLIKVTIKNWKLDKEFFNIFV